MYYSKKIGVFISHIYGDYQQRLCKGIIQKAKEYGMLTEIFASNDGENLGDYGTGEESILLIPKPEDYAGIIFASDTYRLASLKDKISDMLYNEFHCPVIDVTQSASLFPRIELENNHPVEQLVEHLVKVHNKKHICYLGDEPHNLYNQKRLNAYEAGMKKAALTVNEHDVVSCNSSQDSVDAAVTYLFDQEQAPDAIVCYNDTLAIYLINSLKRMGYQVPEQIAVTGCDTLEYGQNTTPTLTSLTFPITEIGKVAVDQIVHLLHKETIDPVTIVTACPHIASSCGCMMPLLKGTSYTYTLAKSIENFETSMIEDMHMSANLQGVNDIDDGMDLLEQFVKNIPSCHEFYLCLYDDWNHISSHIRELTMTEKEDNDSSDMILLKVAMKNGERLPECTFTKRSILPDFIYQNNTGSYVFSPLFFGKQTFGYLALSYDDDTVGYSFAFISWLMNVNSMLKSICDKTNMGLLVERLEDIYTKDEMTGLYNLQGFHVLSTPPVTKAIANNLPIMAAVCDMDCLKVINDTYGHAEGNFAIQVLAHALENSIGPDDICARTGGDEFWILGIDYTAKKATALLEKVNNYLNNYNRLHTKEYNIEVSSGFSIASIEKTSELTALFDAADHQMYQDKKTKVKNILKA